MKQRLSSVMSPSLVLNLLHRNAEDKNTRSASTEVGGMVRSFGKSIRIPIILSNPGIQSG